MLQHVAVGRWSLDAYRGRRARTPSSTGCASRRARLRGARILHVNATAYGGGVSELLRSSVPLLRDLGLTVDWKVIAGSQEFFRATKALHNALQGALAEPERGRADSLPGLPRRERRHSSTAAMTSSSSTTLSRPRC